MSQAKGSGNLNILKKRKVEDGCSVMSRWNDREDLVGQCKKPGFYFKCNGKPLKSFTQGSDKSLTVKDERNLRDH